MPSNLPPKRYDAPEPSICEMLAETLPRISLAEEYEQQDFAKRLIDLQDKKRKGFTALKVSDAFPWLYQLGLISYQKRFMNRGGNRMFLARKGSEASIKSAMEARPWVFNGKWHSRETQEAVARGENPHPPFVEPPTKSEIEYAKKVEADKPKRKKKRKKKKSESKSSSFVESWTGAIENLPSTKRHRSSRDGDGSGNDGESRKKDKIRKAKRKCCDNPHVVRSKKTGKRWCKNCGAKYKPKKPKA